METTLLASAASLAGIERAVNEFWCSTKYRVNPDTLAIEHPERPVPAGVRVVMKGQRFRFEKL
jgi:hypothetical protein